MEERRSKSLTLYLPFVWGCEYGHPEMRRLPDGVFHCPACGSFYPRPSGW